MRRAVWAIGLFALLHCQREAPGPEECQVFAMRALGVRQSADLMVVGAGEKYQELVRQCLTTPFDRALVSCVQHSGPTRRCFQSFERRRSNGE